MYNQLPYKRGTISNANACERCECNGHATSCIYDEEIDALSGSLDINGKFRGGGVCVDCGVSFNNYCIQPKKTNIYYIQPRQN